MMDTTLTLCKLIKLQANLFLKKIHPININNNIFLITFIVEFIYIGEQFNKKVSAMNSNLYFIIILQNRTNHILHFIT